MSRKEKVYHFIYKTTNLINEKYYFGMHSTDNLNDGYIGSGKRLWLSIKKYGKENFKLEIIEFLPDRKSLINKEKEIVNEDLLNDVYCMNLMKGGKGGFISEEQQKHRSSCGGKATSLRLKTDKYFFTLHSTRCSNILKRTHKEGKIKYDTFLGKHHSIETKVKMMKSKNNGEKNSQFGTCWITNGIENKKIKKEDLILFENKSWVLGRIPLNGIGKNQYNNGVVAQMARVPDLHSGR